jgi:syntaxin 5
MAKDRTAEFHNTLLSIKSRSATPQGSRKDEAKQSLVPQVNQAGSSKIKGKGGNEGGGGKSEFGRLASGIAKDINATTMKLQKLAQCES